MSDAFFQAVEKLLGAEHLVSDPVTLSALATGQVEPGALCRPGSSEELAAVLRLAAQHQQPVVPCGGWTAMDHGHAPPRGALMLSLQRLDKLLAHEPADLVVSAQAGLSFGKLEEALFEHGQRLPLEAPSTSTLGGLIATNRSGPSQLAHGTLRDRVLGLQVVGGDGVARRCGGRVVKNVTGYALERLYVGSLGTLGVITEATLRLDPRPETVSVQEIEAPDFEQGFALVRELVARLPLSAAAVGFPAKPFSAQLCVEASPPDHARILRELEAACAVAGARFHESGATGVDSDAWPSRPRRLKAVELSGGRHVEPPLAARLCWPARAGDFPAQMARGDRLALEAGFGLLMGFFDFPAQASLELFPPLNGAGEAEAGGGSAPDLDMLVRTLRGEGLAVTVRWKDPAQPLTEALFGPPREEWKLMRGLKRALDPAGILNPGRFIEGI